MNYTKKMLLIPEDEYTTLMSLYTHPNTDNLNLEKAETDAKMKTTFKDNKLSQIEKGAIINLLTKKRRQLRKMIENRPLKIILESKNDEKPTTGIVPSDVKETNLQQIQDAPNINAEIDATNESVDSLEEEDENEKIKQAKIIPDSLSKIKGIIKPEFYNELKKYIYNNRQMFGVTNVGGIISNIKTQTMVTNSNLLEVLRHLTGEKEASKGTPIAIATSRLYNRLKKDNKFKELVAKSEQHGTGIKRKNYIIQLNTKNKDLKIKTPGLPRFKPKLWVKLPM